MKHSLHAAIVCMAAYAFATAPALARTERFSVISAGEKIGRLHADVQRDAVSINYDYTNNGRGPRLSERLVLNRSGLPIEWQIDGNTMFGGLVRERFLWKPHRASWESQAERDTARAAEPVMYVANDASPWSLGMYTRALLRQARQTLDILPTGRLRLEKLQRTTLRDGSSAMRVTVYALSGLDLAPKLVLLDDADELFAHVGREPGSPAFIIIREGYESYYGLLQELALSLEMERARKLQRELAHRFEQPIRIRNVRVFEPTTGKVGPPTTVVVHRGTIVRVTADQQDTVPSDDQITVDGEGGVLLPGLHDMHSHTSVQSGLLYLAAGVTSTRDMGNDNSFLLDLVRRIDSGEVPGPRIRRNGFLEGRSPYSARLGMIPDTLNEALADVRWYADRGYGQIKIYNSMNPDWVKPIAAEAHRLGMKVSGHIPAFTTADRVLEDGYDEITHLNLLMLSWILDTTTEDTRTPLRITALGRAASIDLSADKVRATIELMKSRDASLDPTAVIIERLMLARAGTVQEADRPYLDHTPIGYQRFRKRSFVNFKDAAEDLAFRKSFDKGLEVLKLLDDNAIRLLPGTDDGSGFSVHRELELYVKAGLPAAKVLRIATLDCERYLGRDQALGSIERGKLADFILVAGDPTRDISNIRQVRMTVKDGMLYFPAEIYQALDIRPFAPPPPIHVPGQR